MQDRFIKCMIYLMTSWFSWECSCQEQRCSSKTSSALLEIDRYCIYISTYRRLSDEFTRICNNQIRQHALYNMCLFCVCVSGMLQKREAVCGCTWVWLSQCCQAVFNHMTISQSPCRMTHYNTGALLVETEKGEWTWNEGSGRRWEEMEKQKGGRK